MSVVLAVKALNQYRKRDIFPYLGLRYYLESSAGRKNRWIEEVCTRLTIDSSDFSYLRTYHFKEYSDGIFFHRDIYLPSPNEILSEVALITELSKFESFKPKPYVYSYLFAKESDKVGVFQPYFNGFRERHKSIAKACWNIEGGVVLYTDIKKFYPSIEFSNALAAWEEACERSKISEMYRRLGRAILEKHRNVSSEDKTSKGILTGPLFSHVIANILLDKIDSEMYEITKGSYWRYVDDVVIVGSCAEVTEWRVVLENKFLELGLELHAGDKDFQVSCAEWMKGENDFEDSFGSGWISLISNIKRFLLANPSKVKDLQEEFLKNNIRIPVVDYKNVAETSTYLQKFQDWRRKFRWATKAVKSITIDQLLLQARSCELEFSEKLNDFLSREELGSLYEQKRATPKLRYLAGRLLYLTSKENMASLYPKLEARPDLYLLAKTMEAVCTRNLSDIARMGVNATHAAAQLLRVENGVVVIDKNGPNSNVLHQSLAVLELNGIDHEFVSDESELRSLAQGENIAELMRSSNGFVRDLACLHGILPSRHQETVDSSFDRDEDLALDVLNQLQNSSHC
ncbi:RNA-directed DNA polymerase [Gilvimarinus agarilyticus]|uniref:RNA-directed DNA polymerase n=1 Tax=Gilvimarinus sp. 2_MG-2023 TaxID=3062666 RepID=UPI001C08A07A|nr:RNA-directed DNA polymerase [Gilvimarinus sp. 2_MG-2023]MBU2885168.1 RNA-directed DNA polymerase [Gilvimarinus agarilyticus]MDO6570067.1 RNA-directed DNA polymerase [Gilvimarinus sp. 2_MG-2023]